MSKELLYPECEVRRDPPLGYDDPAFRLGFLRLEDRVPACHLQEVQGALVAPSGAVFKDGRVLAESLQVSFHGRPGLGSFYKKRLLGRVKEVPGRCFVVHNPFHLNYYHWITEVMPRLFSVRDRIQDRVLLMGEESRVYQAEYLRYFDVSGIVHIGRLELARAGNLLLPPMVSPFPVHNEGLMREMGAWIRERSPSGRPKYERCRNLYIVREPGKWRNLVNQDEVVALLKRYDFEAVCLEGLAVSEQVSLFRNVRNLVSVHGAGMANMIYMDPGGSVIDLINEHHRDPSFYNLACAMKHRQVVFQCATEGSVHRKAAVYDISADVERLQRYLEACRV